MMENFEGPCFLDLLDHLRSSSVYPRVVVALLVILATFIPDTMVHRTIEFAILLCCVLFLLNCLDDAIKTDEAQLLKRLCAAVIVYNLIYRFLAELFSIVAAVATVLVTYWSLVSFTIGAE